jgi:glutathione synthase/RimK-type ligase-like ATP-grasp enzyme
VRRPKVLILANLLDFSTDKVCVALADAGIAFLRLNRDALADLQVRLDPVAPTLEVRHGADAWVLDEGLTSVWFRQPTYLRNPEGRVLSAAEQLSRSQAMAFVRALSVFDQARWVNDPAATYRAESKAWQLRVARQVGFEVPHTLITNDAEAANSDRFGSVVALKAVDTVLLRERGDQLFAFTQILPVAECREEDMAAVPVTLQAALQDKLDLRATVVGDRLWCVAIRCGGEGVEGDWRLRKKDELAYEAYDLPPKIEALCHALMQRMDLVMGCIDLVIADGRAWFIEINPTGEWGWLDTPDRPIARTIAEVLA